MRQRLQTIPVLCQGIFIQKSHPVLILTLSWLIKGKKRAWPPTVALAWGQFQQKLGECLYPGQRGWQLGQLVQLPVL